MKVYDVSGKEVKILVNEIKAHVYYEVKFDGSKHPSGLYYYRMEAGSFRHVRNMIMDK